MLIVDMQDEIDKLDKEMADRHAEELAALEKRMASADDHEEGGNDDDDEAGQLADTLYNTKLGNGLHKVILIAAPWHSVSSDFPAEGN
jgi:hypothetical protein